MNIYRQEFRMARGSMMAWIIALIIVTVLFLSLYPAFSSDVEAMKRMLASYPPQVRAMFGLSMDTFFTFLGFYAYTFTYVGLAGAVQAMNLGLAMLSRETNSKTTDFLLTKPVTRRRVFIQKILSALSVLIITNVALVGATLLLTVIIGVGAFSLRTFALLALAFLLVQLMFLSIGIMVSQLMRVKSVISVSLGIVFSFFALGLIQAIAHDEKLRYLTPFKYFDHMNIVADKSFESPFVWLAVTVIIIPLVIGYIRYTSRDVRSAL